MIPNHPSPSFQLAKKLAYSDEVQANVLEVKAIPGLGTTIGVKICAKELDKAIAGLNLLIANHPDEVLTTLYPCDTNATHTYWKYQTRSICVKRRSRERWKPQSAPSS